MGIREGGFIMTIRERTATKQTKEADLIRESQEMEGFAHSLGAEIYGVTTAESFKEYPQKPQPSKFVPGAKSVIIVGMPNLPELFATVAKPAMAEIVKKGDETAGRSTRDMDRPPSGAERYFVNEEIAMLTNEVTLMGYKIAWKLHREGYRAFYFAPFKQEPRFRTAAFQFMPAMYLAGIGQMGFNCSILTPEYGPRIWVTTIITDKELIAGQPVGPAYNEDCKSCLECVKRCPSRALDGKGWKNPFKCASYGCCGTCLSICPVGQ